jgi:hypothetical protein
MRPARCPRHRFVRIWRRGICSSPAGELIYGIGDRLRRTWGRLRRDGFIFLFLKISRGLCLLLSIYGLFASRR